MGIILNMVNHMVMEYQRNIGSMKMKTVMGNIIVILVSKEQQLILAKPTIESIHHAVHILEKYLGESFMKKAFNDLVRGVNKNTQFNVDKYFVNLVEDQIAKLWAYIQKD